LYSIRAARRRSLPNSPSKGPPTRTLVYSKFARAARARSAPRRLFLDISCAIRPSLCSSRDSTDHGCPTRRFCVWGFDLDSLDFFVCDEDSAKTKFAVVALEHGRESLKYAQQVPESLAPYGVRLREQVARPDRSSVARNARIRLRSSRPARFLPLL
jgi:hypothetical protein